MMADADASPKSQPAKKFTPAERIAELNAIDQSISALLASASEAVEVLANKRDDDTPFASYEAQQDKFVRASSDYFATLSSIEVRLRRQVYALQEAGLVKEGTDKDAKRAKAADRDHDISPGGGPLDSSWLNARADNGVTAMIEKELLEQAKVFLETHKFDKNGM
jgi:hypothetical protein